MLKLENVITWLKCMIKGESTMASVFDVAKYILRQEGSMSTWKLQKLCYYAQAWNLAWTGYPLFSEDFQAWRNGPVCRELFDDHKGLFSICETDLSHGSADNLSQAQIDNIDVVLHTYGKMQPYELREQTHLEDPWKLTRGNLAENENCERIITKDLMGMYYGSL